MDFASILEAIMRIIEFVLSCFEGCFFAKALMTIARKKSGLRWSILTYFSSIIICGMIIFPNDIFNILLSFFWLVALTLLAFHGSILERLGPVSILYPLVLSLNYLHTDLLGSIYYFTGKHLWVDYISTILGGILQAVFWYFIQRYLRKYLKNIHQIFTNTTWLLLNVVCFSSLVSVTAFTCFSPSRTYIVWFACMACIITNVGILYLAQYLSLSIQEKHELKHLKLQHEYYEQFEQNQEMLRKLRHDLNNQLSVIKMLFDTGDKEAAESYFATLEQQITTHNRKFCNNNIVNAVLNAKYNLALANQIDCFFHIDLGDTLNLDPISLCCLFSNTLDNAIEASLKIDDPKKRLISVKARITDSNYFSYEINNQKNNEIHVQNGHYLSDKDDASAHGFGIEAVTDVVRKYDGTLHISYTDDTFTVTVLIRL